jgi:hypothetical protein
VGIGSQRSGRGKVRQRRKGERGYVLATMGVASVVVIGFLGLATDAGRMYISKNEAQAFADAGALAASLALDGTPGGVTRAQTAATSLGNQWNFATNAFSGTTVEVATSTNGPWTSASTPPIPATNYTYVRVTPNVTLPLYFAPVVTAFSGSSVMTANIKAIAVAAQLPQTIFNTGAFPFSPIAFDGPNGGSHTTAPWGFVAGIQYTMRYAANGNSECAGDAVDSDHVKNGSARGFWGSNSASTAAAEVEGLTQEESLTVGEVLPAWAAPRHRLQTRSSTA